MALVAKYLFSNELPTVAATQYTVAASTRTRVTEFHFTNGSGATRTVTIHITKAGAATDNGANAWCVAFDIPQGVPMVFPLNRWMLTTDTIVGVASGTDVTMAASGIEES